MYFLPITARESKIVKVIIGMFQNSDDELKEILTFDLINDADLNCIILYEPIYQYNIALIIST